MIIAKHFVIFIIITSLFSDLYRHFIKLLIEIYLRQLHLDFIDFRNSVIKLATQLFIDLVPHRLFFYLRISTK